MTELWESAGIWGPGFVAMLGLMSLSAFFSASETALFFLSHDELRTMRIGTPRERVAAELLTHPDRLLNAVLFWNLMINLTFFSVSVAIAHQLSQEGYPAVAGALSLFEVVALILFGEVFPKTIAVLVRRRLAPLISWPLALAVRVLDPVTPRLLKLTHGIRRTFWPNLLREPYLEADDLERAVDIAKLSDAVLRLEREVLHNVLDLSELTAEEIMRPRSSLTLIDAPGRLADIKGEQAPDDYILISQPGTEEIERAIPFDDFTHVPSHNLAAAGEDVVFVPWCAKLADVLQTLRENFLSVAVVINEYGDSIGIVTHDDLVDSILLPQSSRARRILQRDPILDVAPGRWHVDGIVSLRDLCRHLNLSEETTDDNLVTVAGLLHDRLERLPVVGDETGWRGFVIRVIDVSKRGQPRVMLSTPTAADSEPPSEKG